jgi:hypothetical protein
VFQPSAYQQAVFDFVTNGRGGGGGGGGGRGGRSPHPPRRGGATAS